jgi:hypothetical protein
LLADQPRRLAQSRPAAGDVAAFELHRDGASAAWSAGRDRTASPVAGTLERRLFGYHLLSPRSPAKKRLAINAVASFPASTKALRRQNGANVPVVRPAPAPEPF